MNHRGNTKRITWLGVLAVLLALTTTTGSAVRPGTSQPNILFIILDDVGIDQLERFNPLQADAPETPTLDAIASGGVAFTRFVVMPECSPTRAAFFTGRYPLRTGVTAAIFESDLPRSQVSPDEVTLPRLLKDAGYTSALLGKYHLGGPHNNPDTFRTPRALGWDYFNGLLDGVPPSMDRTLGGQTDDAARYPFGFPVGSAKGVGWFERGGVAVVDDNGGAGFLGQDIVARGGIPALDADGNFATTRAAAVAGATARGRTPDFSRLNGYYVWPRVINDAGALRQSQSRTYMTTDQTDVSVAWIRSQQRRRGQGRRWMATVSYNAIHTPYQHPPRELVHGDLPENDTLVARRQLSRRMLEAIDKEIGRLLVETGLARYGADGAIVYDPSATDTMIVIAGDNGTQFESVRFPYSPLRSKGTAYQTGVLAPLIVSGPLVHAERVGETVAEQVNAVDLFQLFGEMAGLDVRARVPASHILDSWPMLHHLTGEASANRPYGFAQAGAAVKAASRPSSPCVLSIFGLPVCNGDLFSTERVCTDNGGTWYGPGGQEQYATCCEIEAAGKASSTQSTATSSIQNTGYKLVRNVPAPCKGAEPEYEFYELHPPALLDGPPALLQLDSLTPTQQENLAQLQAELAATLASEPACPGDGNRDKVVDRKDLAGVRRYAGGPSWYDFNDDGMTDGADLAIVTANLGRQCLAPAPSAPQRSGR
jgi:arylsulfatase A-like enzyme